MSSNPADAGLVVGEEPADQPDVDDLMRVSDAVAARLYPGAFRRPLNGKTLVSDDIVILVARTGDGRAAGCCALFVGPDRTGELKRMIVDPRFRGLGVGARLVEAVLTSAASRRIARLQLEVGVRNTEAQALYRKMGFSEREAFGTYRPSPLSLFMERDVASG